MKILVVQDRLRVGGTERQSVFLSNAFSAAGHDTTLLTFRPGGRLVGTLAAGVRRHALQPVDLRLDWFAPGLSRFAAQLAPDVILCMGRMANCHAGALQRRGPATAVIATMRTGKPLPALFRRSLHRVRHVVANSEEARDTLIARYGIPPERITVIYNSIVLDREGTTASPGTGEGGPRLEPAGEDRRGAEGGLGLTLSDRDALRARHGATPQTTVLLCVAMFRPEKNQRELIETIAGLDPNANVQLWLAGDGPARADCESLVAKQALADRVRFVGFHADPTPLYAAADIAVHASWSDALSNFVIESQAHGLPAVVYDSQGMRECVVPGRTGWILPRGDRSGFRTRVMALMQQPNAVRFARAEEARAHARTNFDPARQVEAYLRLFAALCSRR